MMRKIFLTALLLGAFVFSSSCDAAKVDAYRNAMINKSFTLKYNITTPPVRRTNKELHFLKSDLFSTGTFNDLASDDFERRVVSGIIVVDGEDTTVSVGYSVHIPRALKQTTIKVIFEIRTKNFSTNTITAIRHSLKPSLLSYRPSELSILPTRPNIN